MNVSSIITLPFLLSLFATATSIRSFGFSHGSISNAVCDEIEREALLKFKQELNDSSNRLYSWVSDDAECCGWYGVICDDITNHVIGLHLPVLSAEEYFVYNASGDYEEYLESSQFGGNISQSLLNLEHLNYLNLSYNNFGGIKIPGFLGSVESLRYLDLSMAGFGGMVPQELGNLSNLHYLNLNSYPFYMYVENLHWLSSLRSLEFINLSNLNLSSALDWLDVLNTLPSLVELYLRDTELYLGISPPAYINFSSLAVLDLSSNIQGNPVTHWIFDIKTLFSLVLSGNQFVGAIPTSLFNLTLLRELDLSSNSFNSTLPDLLHGFAHLELLDLSMNDFRGTIPMAIRNLSSLSSFDLSYNSLEGEIPNAIGNLASLSSVDLSYNSLGGEIPHAIGNLTFLSSLDLSWNSLEGGIPASLKSLCNLKSLDLSHNALSKEINNAIEITEKCASNCKLEYLDLGSNQLSGQFTDHVGKCKNLVFLRLYNNSISGPISESVGELNFLEFLDLGSNKLNGTLPVSFRMLSSLKTVYISHNSLKGEIFEIHFTNLTNLRSFDGSGNQLAFKVGDDWLPPFQGLINLACNSWQVGPHFPAWIRSLKHLKYLDFSNSKISSTLPIWFHNWSSALLQLNLSHNQMHGTIPYLSTDDSVETYIPYSPTIHGGFSIIDLSSNHFDGSLPFISSDLYWLDLSNNSFSGSISSLLCDKSRTMGFLNLGENFFSGEISDCWMNWHHTQIIRLSNNYFSGNIPKSIGTLESLRVLDLHNNNFSGEIPFSLKNCTGLAVLDLSHNELSGEIPTWIGQQYQLVRIFNLRGNKFHGFITKELCSMTSVQILDFGDNNLSGTIPTCINNWTAMSKGTSGLETGIIYFGFSATLFPYYARSLIFKSGRRVEYSSILNFVRSLDLSSNKLCGAIPKEITSLVALQSLNLSHNVLNGRIPLDIGAMKLIESLDFSQNQLSGEIPQSMSSLTFLSNLNLSYNKLSGIIPSGTQLQGFNPSSFVGNNLCGPPLTQNCTVDNGRSEIDKGSTKDDDNETEAVDWFYFYVSIAPGFVIGFWGVIGPLVFNRRWRNLYFNFLNNLWSKQLGVVL